MSLNKNIAYSYETFMSVENFLEDCDKAGVRGQKHLHWARRKPSQGVSGHPDAFSLPLHGTSFLPILQLLWKGASE